MGTYGESITRLCKIRDNLKGADKEALTWAIGEMSDLNNWRKVHEPV